MNIEIFEKPAFTVIGREGSTQDGPDFVGKLWAEANAHFGEVAHLAKRGENGAFAGFWGAMTDFSRSFQPWEVDFSRGLYLAGVECTDDAVAPAGWTRWEIPGFVYLKAACDSPDLFPKMLDYLRQQGLELAGAAQDFTDPISGRNFMLFPIKRLD